MEREDIPNLTEAERAWYFSLTDTEVEEVRNAYVDKIINNPRVARGMEKTGVTTASSYHNFVKTCAAVAIKLHAGMSAKERYAFRRVEKAGNKLGK